MRKSFFVRRSSRFGTTNLPFFEARFKQTRTKLIVDNSANCYLPLLCPQNDMKTTKNILGIVFHSHSSAPVCGKSSRKMFAFSQDTP